MADGITTQQARSSIKSLVFELNNLTPSSIVTLFEIDISSVLEAQSIPNLNAAKLQTGFHGDTTDGTTDGILCFHNNIKVFDSTVVWQGNTYIPAPIQATGFENSSRGTLPTPILSISSQSETGTDQLALLRYEILKLGDIIGAKVTRRRTFAKYLDWANFAATTSGPRLEELPEGYEPDPNAELPRDIYYIERKTAENKNTIQYQLSSILDLEGIKIPRRTIISDKCNWNYRGPGCWYQHQEGAGGNDAENPVPILQKADLRTGDIALPTDAPPVANDKDERIAGLLGTGKNNLNTAPNKKWEPNTTYNRNSYVYIIKDKIKYYFVSKGGPKAQLDPSAADYNSEDSVPVSTPPPNSSYWIADECSKTLNGCRLRWGNGGSVSQGNCKIGPVFDNASGGLPFGGFPAARKVSQMQ